MPKPASKPATPLEHKTKAAAWSTGLSSLVLAVLYGDPNDVDLTWLPTWARVLAIAALPTIFTTWQTYRAAHTPRPDLEPAAEYSVTTYGEPTVWPTRSETAPVGEH